MSSFSSKQFLISALVAISIHEATSVSISQMRHGDCSFQPDRPVENATFAATDDDTAGVRAHSFIEVRHNDRASFLPLKLEKVEQSGHLGEDQSATLRLIMDCATIEFDLAVRVKGEEYNGTSIQVRVSFEGEQSVIDKPFLSFKKYNYRELPGYSMSWGNLFIESHGSLYKFFFRQLGFVLESKNVTYKYNNGIKNEVGFLANWN